MMGVELRAPTAGDDHVPGWQLLLVGIGGLAGGALAAAWLLGASPAADARKDAHGSQGTELGTEPGADAVGARPATDDSARVETAIGAATAPSALPAGPVTSSDPPAIDPPRASDQRSVEPKATTGTGAPGAPSLPTQAPSQGPTDNHSAGPVMATEQLAPGARHPSDPAPLFDPTAFEAGRLAYLRCTDAPGMQGEDCPRDRRLERQTWAVLFALPQCAELEGLSGGAEVWLTYERGQPLPEVSWKLRPPSSLSAEALHRCAGAELGALTTSIRATSMVLSVRFGLK